MGAELCVTCLRSDRWARATHDLPTLCVCVYDKSRAMLFHFLPLPAVDLVLGCHAMHARP